MIKTKREVIVEALRKIKGVGDFQLVAETEKVALKKSRTTKIPTPANLTKISKVTLATVSLGNDYETAVNERLSSEGKEDNFKAQGTYCIPLSRIEEGLKAFVKGLLSKIGLTFEDKLSKILYKHKEKDQLYVRVYPNLAKEYQSNSVYFDAEGNQLTKEEFKAIEKEYLPLRSEATQGGLEDKIIVNNYKLENILYLGDDEKNPINELTEEKLKLVA
jgi:hypothetical protein